MKNTTESIRIVKDKKTQEILGYVLPGESVLLSGEFIEQKMKRALPSSNPENTVEI